jgi:hypothetical protein
MYFMVHMNVFSYLEKIILENQLKWLKTFTRKKTSISHVIPHILCHDCEPCEEFHIFISQMGVFKDIHHKYVIILKKIEGDNQCEMGQCIKSISDIYLSDYWNQIPNVI